MGCFFSQFSEEDVVTAPPTTQQQATTTTAAAAASSDESVIYKTLPVGAQKYDVRNVYDGDTLTLVNEKRVRFLGIDTPEIKEKQPFAQEAKDYTYTRCHKKQIWISFEPGQENGHEDHYGRLLAWVWIQSSDEKGYECVNEGIVAAGLAGVYRPSNEKKLHNYDKLLRLQTTARLQRKGMWSTFKDYEVVKTPNGSAFHKRDCKHLSNSKNLVEVNASVAMDQGLHACRTCLADA